MNRWLVILTFLASRANGACDLNPSSVARVIATDGPKAAIARLWDGASCERLFLDHLEAGDSEWLKVAEAVRPYVDAWPSESLKSSMSIAMMNAPSRVLPLIRVDAFGTEICVPEDFDDSPGQEQRAQHNIAVVEAMYKRFLKTPLASEAAQCLSAVERTLEANPALRPNTSLERTRDK